MKNKKYNKGLQIAAYIVFVFGSITGIVGNYRVGYSLLIMSNLLFYLSIQSAW